MRPLRLLLAGLALAAPALHAGEITLLKGGTIKGDIVSVTESGVTYAQGGVEKSTAIRDVLRIDYRAVGRPGADEKYSLVELADGSSLLAGKVLVKKRELHLKLLSWPDLRLPLSAVANILMNGHDEKFRRDWKTRLLHARGRELIVLNKGGIISSVAATLGEGDPKTGESINIAVDVGGPAVVTARRELANTHGLIFKITPDVKAPAVLCRLFDTLGNVVMVSSLKPTEGGGLDVTTPSGAKLSFKKERIARLDYTKGKLDPLSEMKADIIARSNLDEDDKPDQWHVYVDTNLNKGPITLGGVVYKSGLAIKPHAELTYDLRGEYRELSMLVGIDDNVSASGATVLVVEGDGKEITTLKISSADKVRFKPLTLNIKGVQKLKITVKADGDFDVGRHLNLADAKVSK